MPATNGTSNGASYTVPLWIDGKEVTTSTTFPVTAPATHKELWQSAAASPDDATAAVEAASRAFKTWRRTKPAEIRKIFLKAADLMEERIDELASYQVEETGAGEMVAKGFNLPTTIEMLRDIAGRVTGIMGAIPTTVEEGTGAFVFKEPFGVIYGIAPWNGPYILGLRAIAYAIATGNTTVLKGSELSPRCFWAIGSIFHDAGLPAGVLNVIYHRPQDAIAVSDTIISHFAVKKVNFTGSTAVGSSIASKAGKELKPVLMELGGKASAYVCEDADLDAAAFQCALGAFIHAGQICMATERIIVHRKVLEPFSDALKKAAEKIYPASGDSPILVMKPAVERNQRLVKDATEKGAKVVFGDVAAKEDSAYRMRPVIVTDVNRDMEIFYTESFGPTVSLIPVDSDDEAIELANDTEYGLSGAVFSANLGRGLRFAREVDTGAVHINQMSVHDEAAIPHGGVKKSGWGRFNGQWGLEEFLKLKTVTFKDVL
ncbi:hypothetical protein H2203_006920 [Taxawa tesnikishii (nom. ined.)]|nr:hypothetical protein H2203_006920 [Dothideales sp. JES 119]